MLPDRYCIDCKVNGRLKGLYFFSVVDGKLNSVEPIEPGKSVCISYYGSEDKNTSQETKQAAAECVMKGRLFLS